LIVDRYLMRLVLVPTLTGFALLVLLVSAFNAGVLLRDAAYSRVPLDQVLTMIGLRDLIAADVLLPTSLYIGVLTTLNQWHRNREAFALYGAGVRPNRAARPVWLIAMIVSIVVAGLSWYARPWAFAESYRLDAAANELASAAMQPDRFYTFGGTVVLSAAEIDRANDEMHGVFIETATPDQVRVIRAQSGKIHATEGGRRQYIELEHGTTYLIGESSRADRVTTFENLSYYAPGQAAIDVENKRRAMPTAALVNTTDPKERAELQWRMCLPLIALLMTFIAVEIARALPGSSAYPRFLAGIAVYTIVFNLAAVGRTWVENGRVAPIPGMLWVPVFTALLYVLVRQIPAVSMRRPG
jgi:lipopolysaccharide export system permease protein